MRTPQSKKNCINMHDIIAQPLGALPGAVDAILRRPEELDDVEVQSIFKEASFIVLRAEEAQSARDADAFCALFKLFSEGFAHDEASFDKGIETFERNGTLLQTLRGILHAAVRQKVFHVQSDSVVELLQVIGCLCDGSGIKDVCGAFFIEDLVGMLDDMYSSNLEEAQANFFSQRAAATALINLVKGSKQNKQRIFSCKFLMDCCALSVDVFFQLQCIELLFRLSRHNNSLLLITNSRLSSKILDDIAHLPNNATLLPKMIELLSEINKGRDHILSFPLNRTDVGQTTVTEKTVSYFTKDYFVVLVTSNNADNVTIPYKFIRSVTIGKDGRVIFRLDEFPRKLGAFLDLAAGMDTITLFVTAEKLALFKNSSIRSWIMTALSAKREQRKNKPLVDDINDAANPLLSTGVPVENKTKRYKSESLQLAGDEPQAWNTFQKLMESSHNDAGIVVDKMKQLVESNNEFKYQEVAAILDATMRDIQEMVDNGHVATDGFRDTFKGAVEGDGIHNIEYLLEASQSKVLEVVGKLNHALQELKDSNVAIHEQIACIEITLQQTLEVSREEEMKVCRSLKAECEERTGRLEALLDRRVIEQLDPMQAFSQLFETAANAGSHF